MDQLMVMKPNLAPVSFEGSLDFLVHILFEDLLILV